MRMIYAILIFLVFGLMSFGILHGPLRDTKLSTGRDLEMPRLVNLAAEHIGPVPVSIGLLVLGAVLAWAFHRFAPLKDD